MEGSFLFKEELRVEGSCLKITQGSFPILKNNFLTENTGWRLPFLQNNTGWKVSILLQNNSKWRAQQITHDGGFLSFRIP
jgi:hypothetical protein